MYIDIEININVGNMEPYYSQFREGPDSTQLPASLGSPRHRLLRRCARNADLGRKAGDLGFLAEFSGLRITR